MTSTIVPISIVDIAYILANNDYLHECQNLLFLTTDTYTDEQLIIPLLYHGYGTKQRTLLQYSCYKGNLERTKLYIQYHANPDYMVNLREPSALVWCILQGHTTLFTYLIEYFYDLQYKKFNQKLKNPTEPIIVPLLNKDNQNHPNHNINDDDDDDDDDNDEFVNFYKDILPINYNYNIPSDTRIPCLLYSSLQFLYFSEYNLNLDEINEPMPMLPLKIAFSIDKENSKYPTPITEKHGKIFTKLLFTTTPTSIPENTTIIPSTPTTTTTSSTEASSEITNTTIYYSHLWKTKVINDDYDILLSMLYLCNDNTIFSSINSIQIYLLSVAYEQIIDPFQLFHYTLLSNNTEVFKYLYENYWIDIDNESPAVIGCFVSYYGNTLLYTYLRNFSRPLSHHFSLCSFAAQGNQFAFLQMLHAEECPWSTTTTAGAAESGNLAMLQWLREHNCPWAVDTCIRAAEYGHLSILEWARNQIPPCPWDAKVSLSAAKFNHLPILQYLRNNHCQWNENIAKHFCYHGHLNYLPWLKIQEYPYQWNSTLSQLAAMGGHLDVLIWLKQQDPPCPIDNICYIKAIIKGNLRIVQWLYQQKIPWNIKCCTIAARYGYFHILQWLREQDPPCPWDEKVCKYGNLYLKIYNSLVYGNTNSDSDKKNTKKENSKVVQQVHGGFGNTRHKVITTMKEYLKLTKCPCEGYYCK